MTIIIINIIMISLRGRGHEGDGENAEHGLTSEIGTPPPQLEHQITNLDKCDINCCLSETPV